MVDAARSLIEFEELSSEQGFLQPIMVLRELEGKKRCLPIGVSVLAALKIATQKSGRAELQKPGAIDLLLMVLKGFDIELVDMEITAIKEAVYAAQMTLVGMGKQLVLPIKPSDCVLLSMLTARPFYCYEDVFSELYNLTNDDGDIPVIKESERNISMQILPLLAAMSGRVPPENHEGEDCAAEPAGAPEKEEEEENAEEEQAPAEPAALLLGDENVDPEILKELLSNLDRRYFGRYKM